MANTKSAKKATRVSARRATINKNRTSRVRSSLRKVEEAIGAGNKEEAVIAMKAAEPELMRGAHSPQEYRLPQDFAPYQPHPGPFRLRVIHITI
jgi:small subunit ribosomal protein S20